MRVANESARLALKEQPDSLTHLREVAFTHFYCYFYYYHCRSILDELVVKFLPLADDPSYGAAFAQAEVETASLRHEFGLTLALPHPYLRDGQVMFDDMLPMSSTDAPQLP